MDKQRNKQKKDLARCNKISVIVPSIYYGIQQLKRLDKHFEQNDMLNQTDVLLLELFSLLDIKEGDTALYIQQYREMLAKALKLLGDFLLELKQTDNIEKSSVRLFIIMNGLARDQKNIASIIR